MNILRVTVILGLCFSSTVVATNGFRGRSRGGRMSDSNDTVTAYNESECHFSPRCSQRLKSRKAETQDNFGRYPCHCDDMCHIYGDCCLDAQEESTGHPRNVPKNLEPEHFSCLHLDPENSHLNAHLPGVKIVTKCPRKSRRRISRKCSKEISDDNYRYFYDQPVVSESSGLIYANVFCAKCHDDEQLVRYNVSLGCNCNVNITEYLKTMQYQRNRRVWERNRTEDIPCPSSVSVVQCKLEIPYPRIMGRHCEVSPISSCSEGWKDKQEATKCSSVNYNVMYNFTTFFKNEHCARCNYIGKENISCLPAFFNLGSRNFNPPPSARFQLSDLFSTNRKCSDDEVEDIVFDRCEKLKLDEEESESWKGKDIFYLVLMSLSLVAMVVHMIIFILLFKQRNLHTKNLFCMVFSLFWAELLLLILSRKCFSITGCYVSTMIVYYLFMTAFFWMNVMSYDICKTFHTTKLRDNSSWRFKRYSFYAYGCPAILCSVALIVDLTAPEATVSPGFGDNGFWFSNRGGLLLFFVGPTEFLFLTNMAMLVVSIYNIYQHQKLSRFARTNVKSKKEIGTRAEDSSLMTSKEKVQDTGKLGQIHDKIKDSVAKVKVDKERLVLYTKLALIMGVPWFFAFFDYLSIVFDYIFNILNSLQGLLIFVSFDCKIKIWVSVCERLGWEKAARSLASGNTHLLSSSSTRNRGTLMTSTSSGSAAAQQSLKNKQEAKYEPANSTSV